MTYRAGIIGAGGIAGLGILGMHSNEDIGKKRFEASHAGGYEATDDVELVAIADVDTDKLERFGSAWGIPPERRYVGHEAMLAAEDLDIISVCTPSYLHRQHVVDAAKSPANPSVIWCEKPIASNVTDAHEMCEVCAETDTELVINHAFRFTEKLQHLRTHVQDGLVGDVKAVSTHFRRELLRASTHQIDTLVYLLDARASTVSGYINGENDSSEILDTGTEVDDAGGGGMVVMDDGTFAMIDCTLERSMSSMSFELLGTTSNNRSQESMARGPGRKTIKAHSLPLPNTLSTSWKVAPRTTLLARMRPVRLKSSSDFSSLTTRAAM